MASSSAFWDSVTAKYIASPIKDVAAYEDTMARVDAHLTPDARVLEIGAGSGNTAIRLAPKVAQMHATDFSANMIAAGKATAQKSGLSNITFAQTGAQTAAAPGDNYDVVLAFSVLHLLEDLPATLTTLHAGLRPGGVLISKTAGFGAWSWPIKAVVSVLHRFGKAPFVAFRAPAAYEAALESAGFTIEDARGIPKGTRNHFIIARKKP